MTELGDDWAWRDDSTRWDGSYWWRGATTTASASCEKAAVAMAVRPRMRVGAGVEKGVRACFMIFINLLGFKAGTSGYFRRL